jgi:hypothetical protein
MTAEVKQSGASSTIKKRGKRIGPSNVEAKRAAALRQAASAAEVERRSTAGVASTISILQLLRDATLTGTIPSNEQLVATIRAWASSAALKGDNLSPTGARLVQDLQGLTVLLCEFLETRNSDGLLQSFLHHVHLAAKLAGVDVAIAGWRTRGQIRRRMNRGGVIQAGGRGKISIWRSADSRQKVYLGGEHSRISGIDAGAPRDQEEGDEVMKKTQKRVAKDARALLRIAQQLLISTDFRDLIVKIQRIAKRVIEVAKMGDDERSEQEEIIRDEQEEEVIHEDEQDEIIRDDEFIHEQEVIHEDEKEHENINYHSTTDNEQFITSIDHDIRKLERDEAITSAKFDFETAKSLPIVERDQPEVKTRKSSQKSSVKPSHKSSHKSQKRRQILVDLKEIFGQLAGNKQFARAINDFYRVLLKMRQSATETAKDARAQTEIAYDANFRTAQDELLAILERLTGKNVSLTPVIENLRQVRKEARDDYQLRDFLGDWRAFLKRSMDPKYIDSSEYMNRGEFLLKRTEAYFEPGGQYRTHLDESFDGLNEYIDALRSDQLTRNMGRQINKLIREDLIGIGRGEPLSLRSVLTSSTLLRPDLINDFRFHILPRILREMHSIPLPRIEVVSGGTVLVLEDLIIPADALVPLQLEILTSSHLTMNPKARLFRRRGSTPPRLEGVQGGVQLKLSAIAGQVRNVRFTLDRHEGWPQFSDQGLADLRIAGSGLSIFIDLVSHPASEITGRSNLSSSLLPAALIAHHVRVRIDKLSLNLHDSLHDSMYKIFNPIVASVIKRNMERAIRDQIINIVDSIDGLLDRLSQSITST